MIDSFVTPLPLCNIKKQTKRERKKSETEYEEDKWMNVTKNEEK